MSLLRVRGVRIGAAEAPRLEVADLAVEEKEVLVVLGATGAGKSTLLRVLGLIERPQAGEWLWRETPIAWPPSLAERRRITMAFQDPLLFSGTVAENVDYGLKIRGLPLAERKRRVTETLHLLQIDALAERDVCTLSGGEAHRTSLARALVLDPDLLLLDEPLASLDELVRERLLEELIGIVRGRGLTCVFVTHDQAEAMAIADRVAVVEAGKVAQLGSPDQVFYRPTRVSVARLLRAENLLDGTITSEEEGIAQIAVGGRIIQVVGSLAVGTHVTVCLRPEEIVASRPAAGGSDSARNRLSGRIVRIVPLGATVKITADCGFPLVALITRRSAQELALEIGCEVMLSFKATAVHLILADTDTASGKERSAG